jgi:putative transposase
MQSGARQRSKAYRGVALEPWRNGYIESFNSRIRDECLNINVFWSLTQARVVISDWKHDYNHRRRHSSLGYQPPAVYAATCTHR